jgi:hypothetical protein
LLIKSDHATASGIGEGAHAAAASFAGICQCHAGVRKAALPDGRRRGAARRQAKLAKRRAELTRARPDGPVTALRCPEHVPNPSRTNFSRSMPVLGSPETSCRPDVSCLN